MKKVVKKTLSKAQFGKNVGPTKEQKKEYREERRSDRKAYLANPDKSLKEKVAFAAAQVIEAPKKAIKAAIDPTYRNGRYASRNPWDQTPKKSKVSTSEMGSFKKGGSVKAKNFAALAKPYNKATAADRIAGAKKNKRK